MSAFIDWVRRGYIHCRQKVYIYICVCVYILPVYMAFIAVRLGLPRKNTKWRKSCVCKIRKKGIRVAEERERDIFWKRRGLEKERCLQLCMVRIFNLIFHVLRFFFRRDFHSEAKIPIGQTEAVRELAILNSVNSSSSSYNGLPNQTHFPQPELLQLSKLHIFTLR